MLILFNIARKYYARCQRCISFTSQYRSLSALPSFPISTPNSMRKYWLTDLDISAIDRSLKLAKSRKFDDLLSFLNCDPSLSRNVFTKLIQHKFGLPTLKEIELKERIVGIMEKGGMKLDADNIVPLISL